MIAVAALALLGTVLPATDPALGRAQAELKSAYDARWIARASVCGDRGREAELLRIDHEYETLAAEYRRRTSTSPIAYWTSYHGEGCKIWGRYRPSVIIARLALANAREALGLEE